MHVVDTSSTFDRLEQKLKRRAMVPSLMQIFEQDLVKPERMKQRSSVDRRTIGGMLRQIGTRSSIRSD